jgi:hypothetical protein
MNWKGFGRRQLCPTQDTITVFTCRYWGKSQNTCRDSCWDLKRADPKYKSRALLFEPTSLATALLTKSLNEVRIGHVYSFRCYHWKIWLGCQVSQWQSCWEWTLTLQSPVVTICTTCFNTLKLHSAHTVYLCVPYGSHNKQRLFPQTALTGWAL